MTTDAFPGFEAGQQMYAMISHCRRPQGLWRRLSSGHYDWLGVRADGRFVLGRPRLAPVTPHQLSVTKASGANGGHRVEYARPFYSEPDQEWYATADEARKVYAAASMPEASPLHNSGIWHVRLYADGQLEADAYILNRLPKIY